MSLTRRTHPTGIGFPITGGVDNELLYIDGSGNLAQTSNMQYRTDPTYGNVIDFSSAGAFITRSIFDGGVTGGSIYLGDIQNNFNGILIFLDLVDDQIRFQDGGPAGSGSDIAIFAATTIDFYNVDFSSNGILDNIRSRGIVSVGDWNGVINGTRIEIDSNAETFDLLNGNVIIEENLLVGNTYGGTTSRTTGDFFNSNNAAVMSVQNLSYSGWSAFDIYDYNNSQVGGFGYGNPGVGNFSDQIYIFSQGRDIVLSTGGAGYASSGGIFVSGADNYLNVSTGISVFSSNGGQDGVNINADLNTSGQYAVLRLITWDANWQVAADNIAEGGLGSLYFYDGNNAQVPFIVTPYPYMIGIKNSNPMFDLDVGGKINCSDELSCNTLDVGTGALSTNVGGLTVAQHLESQDTTPSRPVITNSSNVMITGTYSGNTTELATVTGSLTSGNFLKSDASGNVVDGGAAVYGAISAILTGRNAAVTSVVAVTSPNDGANHIYNVGGSIVVTAVSLNAITLQVAYTDETSTSRTQSFFGEGLTTAAISTTGGFAFPPMTIISKPNTTITISTTVTGVGTETYDVAGYIQRIS